MADTDNNSFGRKILGFFINQDATTPGTPLPKTGPAPVSSAPVAANSVATVSGSIRTGSIDTKFVGHFADVLAKANIEGPDYFEFRETLKSLADIGLDENKRYQAAWASFRAMTGQADTSILTSAANQYLTALNADREQFLKSVEAALAERVGGLQNEQKQLQTDNEALQKQIADLQNRLTANTDRLSKLDGEMAEQSQKLTQNRQNFEATYASFTDQIKQDVSNIQTYLK
jgi:cytochrome c556